MYRGQLFAENLCTASEDIPLSVKYSDTGSDSVSENASAAGNPLGFEPESVHAVGLFDVNNAETDCAYNIHKKIYPASTTKILTALVALENGNLSDTVTVADEADSGKFAADEQTCDMWHQSRRSAHTGRSVERSAFIFRQRQCRCHC